MAKSNDNHAHRLPPLAIAAGAIGFALTAGMAGFLGWQALEQSDSRVPAIVIEAGEVHRTPAGFVVEFEAHNRAARTAANVEVEARVGVPGSEPIVSTVELGYVAGHSSQRGGVVLPADPRSGELTLRALGYSEP